MKLLFDENLSDRLIGRLHDLFPMSAHVKTYGLIQTDDATIWEFARQHGFAIVSKDADFHQRSLVYGAPPKFIFLRVGNCSTQRVGQLLRLNFSFVTAFLKDAATSILVLP